MSVRNKRVELHEKGEVVQTQGMFLRDHPAGRIDSPSDFDRPVRLGRVFAQFLTHYLLLLLAETDRGHDVGDFAARIQFRSADDLVPYKILRLPLYLFAECCVRNRNAGIV